MDVNERKRPVALYEISLERRPADPSPNLGIVVQSVTLLARTPEEAQRFVESRFPPEHGYIVLTIECVGV
jgi:hypothetical protein